MVTPNLNWVKVLVIFVVRVSRKLVISTFVNTSDPWAGNAKNVSDVDYTIGRTRKQVLTLY